MKAMRIALGILLATLMAGPVLAQEQGAPAAKTPAGHGTAPATQATPSAAQNDQEAAPKSASNPAPADVGGMVEKAKLIHMVQPLYPEDARKANISGTVVLHGVITKDGSLQQIEVVSGPDELRQAAIDAVKQWQFQPATLSGKPAEAATTISLVFGIKPSEGQAPTASPNAPAGASATGSDQSAAADALKEPELAPKPPPPSRSLPARIRVGGSVQEASLVKHVFPVYPPIARTAHVSGTVVLHVIVARDGSIQTVQYVSGPALLLKAAMDAVKQWRYRPTLLNGQPVEVDTTIQVIFALGR